MYLLKLNNILNLNIFFFLFFALFLNIGISLFYFYALITIFINYKINKYSFRDINFSFLYFFIFFIMLSFYLLSENLDYSKIFKQFFYLKFFLLFIYLDYSIKRFDNIENSFKIFFILIFIIIIDIYFQRFFNLEFLDNEVIYERASGPYVQMIAGTLILFLGFHGFLQFLLKNFFKNLFLKYSFFIIFFNFYFFSIFITGDRMNFLLSIFVIFLMFIFLPRERIKIFFSSVMLILLVFLTIIKNESLNKKYSNMIKLINLSKVIEVKPAIKNPEKETNILQSDKDPDKNIDKLTNYHFVLWVNSYELWKKKPFFGHGLGSYRYKCSSNDNLNYYIKEGRCNTHPHNLYAEILSELGILGFFILLIIFAKQINFSFLKKILFLIKNSNENYNQKKILFLSFFIIMIVLIWPIKISGRLFSNFYGTIFWFNIFFFILYLKNLKKNFKD